MNYKQFLTSSKLALVTLIILVIDILAAIYIVTQVARYMGTLAAVIGFAAVAIIGGLIWFCHYKKPKVAVVVEILLTIALVIGIIGVGKINSVTGKISRTTEYEVVQIVTLKDNDIEADDDFETFTLGYTNSDDGAYEKSSEILVENDKKVKESKPYEDTELSLIHI